MAIHLVGGGRQDEPDDRACAGSVWRVTTSEQGVLVSTMGGTA